MKRQPNTIPAQRLAIDGCEFKHRRLVNECLDLMDGLGMATPRVGIAHSRYFTVHEERLAQPLPEVLKSLRPIELRSLHARLTGDAVRAIHS